MAGGNPISFGISVEEGRGALEEAGETAGALGMGVAKFGGGRVGLVAANEVETGILISREESR